MAVKVQRPFVADAFKHDFRYVRFATFMAERLGMAPQFRWNELVRELEHTIADELDYRKEAASIRRMRKALRRHKVYLPKVFTRCCSHRVLVMEFIEGVYMSEYIKAADESPDALGAWRPASPSVSIACCIGSRGARGRRRRRARIAAWGASSSSRTGQGSGWRSPRRSRRSTSAWS